MAATSPYRPNTTESKLALPLNGSIFTTRREVNPRKPTVDIGGTMESELGTAWADSYVIGSGIVPDKSLEVQQFTHAQIPTVAVQLNSNWEWTSVDLGGRRFEGVARTFVYLATAFDEETLIAGAAMEIGSDNHFSGDGYILVDRDTSRMGMELEPTFRVERRTYIQRTVMGVVTRDIKTGRGNRSTITLYYRGEQVSGTAIETLAAAPDNAYWGLQTDGTFRELEQLTTDWFSVTESSVIPANAVNSLSNPAKTRITERVTPLDTDVMFSEIGAMPDPEPLYGSAHYDGTAWPDHKLVLIQADDASGYLHKFTYVADRATQDEYNFSHTQANIGGSKYEVVKRDYVVLRSAFDPQSPLPASTMPNTPTDLFATGYVLIEKEQRRIGKELDSLYVSETRTYAKRCSITQLGVDAFNGKALTSIETLWHKDEVVTGTATTAAALFAVPTNAYWGLQADGTQASGRQLSCHWYSITVEVVIGGPVEDGVVAVDSFTTNDNYFWPAILSYFSLFQWTRRDGGVDTYPTVKFLPEAYSGPCLTTVTRTWSPTAFTIPKVNQMMPTRVSVACPYFSLNIPECLHAEIDLTISSGTVDPEYEYIIQTEFFPATNYEVWPDTITAYDDQTPFRGGFLRTVRVVSKPE
tara:strand:- start:18125 stop:20044 length:1920 start_codon:yes stop_codon:yes gene_type:complete